MKSFEGIPQRREQQAAEPSAARLGAYELDGGTQRDGIAQSTSGMTRMGPLSESRTSWIGRMWLLWQMSIALPSSR